ncbi:hypothetical protein N478_16915 [Pseudoalteromonas luteoviolacea S4060-1]|uniref:Uncharacterized protein n=1 Tax=Pseudoalteromonas luteoviolacea S4060-1 TaxID=1365257 RepID=A0A167NC87_9GAMM|nr:hypothetical protein N478_16915 [Pseudoalteromonas luteoviolacea S4060-1]
MGCALSTQVELPAEYLVITTGSFAWLFFINLGEFIDELV